MAYRPGSHQMADSGDQLNAEVGYGLPAGRFVGTPRVGYSASQYGRDYRMGYSLELLDSEELRLEALAVAHDSRVENGQRRAVGSDIDGQDFVVEGSWHRAR